MYSVHCKISPTWVLCIHCKLRMYSVHCSIRSIWVHCIHCKIGMYSVHCTIRPAWVHCIHCKLGMYSIHCTIRPAYGCIVYIKRFKCTVYTMHYNVLKMGALNTLKTCKVPIYEGEILLGFTVYIQYNVQINNWVTLDTPIFKHSTSYILYSKYLYI